MERIRPIITSFSFPGDKEDVMLELKIIAAREKKFMSDIIFDLIEQYVKAHSKGNDTFKLDTWNEDPTFKAVPTILSQSEKWYKYLQDCTAEERLQIQIQANQINKQCLHLNQK